MKISPFVHMERISVVERQKLLYGKFIQLWETADQGTMPSLNENRSTPKISTCVQLPQFQFTIELRVKFGV